METVTLERLNQIIETEDFRLMGTPAAAAYLNHLLEPALFNLEHSTAPQVDAWLARYKALLSLELDSNLNPVDLERLTWPELKAWIVYQIVVMILDGVNAEYETDRYITNRDVFQYENLTLTPWDLALSIGQFKFLSEIIRFEFDREELPVSVVVEGNSFTHLMRMDVAMGILLFAQTAGVTFEMTMYGAPLTYFLVGQDDLYERYEDYATEGELRLRMVGNERWYYFFEDDFLRGIKTGAEWVGVDHHDYWDVLQTAEGQPLTFS